MRIILVLLLTGLTLGSCQKMVITERDYPRLKTEAVTNITKSGATFNASTIYRGNFEILNYGFAWTQSNRPSIILSDRIFYTDNIQEDNFSADISSTLKEGDLYYVRAFIETKDYLVCGDTAVFKSKGSNDLANDQSTILPESPDIPGYRSLAAAFVMEDFAYFGTSLRTSSAYNYWEFYSNYL